MNYHDYDPYADAYDYLSDVPDSLLETSNDGQPSLSLEATKWLIETLFRNGEIPEAMAERDSRDRIFTSYEERREIYIIGRRLAEYAVNENIEAVYFLDRSARPAYVAMREFWKVQYPDVSMPKIGFLNPKGFVSREDLRSGAANLDELMLNDEYKQGEIENPENIRSRQEIIDEMRQKTPDDVRENPVLLFDACIHSGDSIRPILNKLDEAGMQDVRFGVVSPRNNRSDIDLQFVTMDKVPAGVCYPFDKDELTQKTYTSIHSNSNITAQTVKDGRELRAEIRQIIKEFTDRELVV